MSREREMIRRSVPVFYWRSMSDSIPLVRRGLEQSGEHNSDSSRYRAIKNRLSRVIRAKWFCCVVMATVAVLVHSPALQGQQIWDDGYLVGDNPFIKSPFLILETFRHYLFLDSFSPHYRPVQNISYMMDYLVWNTNEFGFHLTNVLLHIGSAIVLYFLLRQLFASFLFRSVSIRTRNRLLQRIPWISHCAFFVSLLWATHPVHSAAVDYISGRADSLAFLFASTGWLLFFHGQRTSCSVWRIVIYLVAAVGGLLALLSREIAVIWVLLFVAHLFFVEREISARLRLASVIFCVSVLAAYAGLRCLPMSRPTFSPPPGLSAPVRVTLMARSLGDYGRLMLFPARLYMERTVFYPQGYGSNANWRKTIATDYLSILGLVVLIGLIMGCLKKGRGQLMRVFGAAWFLAGYLPVSNIVSLNATVAEHWLYLPSVGCLIFAAGCVIELPARRRYVAILLATIAIGGFSVRSFIRSSDWVNEETFYNRTFDAGSRSARVAVNLAQIYAAKKEYIKAEKIFRLVLDQNPDYPIAQNALASVMYQQGRFEEAQELYAEIEKKSVETRKEYPRTWIGAYNLALVFHKSHHNQSALTVLDKAHKDYSDIWDIVCLEAEIVRETQGPDAALQLVADFANKNWWHHGAALALGQLYAQKGDVGHAEEALRNASWLDIHDAQSLQLLAQIEIRENRLGEALRTQRRAVARQPDEPRQYIFLSDILERIGHVEEARTALAQATHLRELVAKSPSGTL
jgi:Flp pilus assembly protein TadD